MRHPMMLLSALPLLAVMLLAPPASAASPRPGDFVMVKWGSGTASCCQVVTLDAVSLTESIVSTGGYIVGPQDIAASTRGDIFVTVPTTGIIRVNPSNGEQSVFASITSLGGGAPVGITVTPTSTYVTIQGNPSRVVELDAEGSVARVISSGGLLSLPAGLVVGADGALYVCETLPTGIATGGGLVRIDLGIGAQSLVASEEPVHGPFDVALAPDGTLWSIQRGYRLHERRGALVRTSLPGGASEKMPTSFDGVSGVAIRSDGVTLVADCAPVHGDCYYASTRVYPDGPRVSTHSDGPMAVVPDQTTSVIRSSWGRLKTIHR